MKQIFIPVKSAVKIKIAKSNLANLPSKVIVVTTQQLTEEVMVFCKKQNLTFGGVVLGCSIRSAESYVDSAEAFLFIGTGEFHPINIALKTGKPVYMLDHLRDNIELLDPKKVDVIKKRKKGAILKFLSSSEIGMMISTKQGQNNYSVAQTLTEKYKDKQFYFFMADTFSYAELENFPFIECFVNTACPRIGTDDAAHIAKCVVNLEDVISL